MASNCIRCRHRYENIIQNDIKGIYGAACVVLHERWGFGDKRLTDFINAVQIVWDAVTAAGVPMTDFVKEKTGFEFEQIAKVK